MGKLRLIPAISPRLHLIRTIGIKRKIKNKIIVELIF